MRALLSFAVCVLHMEGTYCLANNNCGHRKLWSTGIREYCPTLYGVWGYSRGLPKRRQLRRHFCSMGKRQIDAVIINTAAKKGVGAAIVEKDLWVSLTLDYLFHHCRWKDRIAFKGGTCLSKVYGLIEPKRGNTAP